MPLTCVSQMFRSTGAAPDVEQTWGSLSSFLFQGKGRGFVLGWGKPGSSPPISRQSSSSAGGSRLCLRKEQMVNVQVLSARFCGRYFRCHASARAAKDDALVPEPTLDSTQGFQQPAVAARSAAGVCQPLPWSSRDKTTEPEGPLISQE